MDKEELQSLVESFKATGQGLDLIFEEIARLLYVDPERFGFDGEDDAAEVLIRFRKRIRNLPLRYVAAGSSFEAYLSTCLRYLARTMRREGRRRRERELVCEKAEAWSMELGRVASFSPWRPASVGNAIVGVAEDGEVYEAGATVAPAKASVSERAAFKDRLVFLYLKCAWEADDERTCQVAHVAGVDPAWLSAAVNQALRSLEPERLRHERLAVRRDRAWSRIRLLEGRLRDELDADARERTAQKLDRERRRLSKARAEIKVFRPVVSNSIVARILGVPKGTVDCGIYMLKKREAGRGKGRGVL